MNNKEQIRKKDVFDNSELKAALGQKTPSVAKNRRNRKSMVKNASPKEEIATEDTISDESSDDLADDQNDTSFLDYFDLDMDLFVNGKQIIDDSQVKLFKNRKYGLVGKNGAGKTTLLRALKKRQFGVPKAMKVHLIKQEFSSNKTVIEYVGLDGGKSLQLLGFVPVVNSQPGMQSSPEDAYCAQNSTSSRAPAYNTPINDLSGGWRMRVQLAKAIHKNSELLLLDEPTNFLDIETITFLEEFVKNLKTVIIVSHDKHFLNSTCDSILHLNNCKVTLYKGNYDAFLKQYDDIINNQIKLYNEQQVEIEHLMSFINRFRANAARSSQAQSRMKVLEKMEKLEMPKTEPKLRFRFQSDKLASELVIELRNASYSYGTKMIFNNINFKINSGSRIVIVGGNGQGKSTLLKLLDGQITDGGEDKATGTDLPISSNGPKFNRDSVIVNPDCKISYFAQHHIDQLNMSMDAVTYLTQFYPLEESRRRMSNFGLINNQDISTLSGGQKSRLAFARMGVSNLLILDEPTNHLDIVAISALSEAINEYKGAVICVSHDMAFLEECFDEVYVCEKGSLVRYNGTPEDYKNELRTRINQMTQKIVHSQ